jgi:hypothetical protein
VPDLSSPEVRTLLEAGVELFVGYEASDGSGTPEGRERGVRRIPLRLTATPNRNPVVEDVLVGDTPLGSAPLAAGQEVVLRPRLAEGSAETFTDAGGTSTGEAVFYSWHATGDGEVQQFRSREPANGEPGEPTVDYEPPTAPGPVTFYVVARDGREGVGWLVRTVQVAAPGAAP